MRYPNAYLLISCVRSFQDSILIQPLPRRFTSSLFLAAWYLSSPKSFSPFLNPYCGVDLDASISKYFFIIWTPACSATTIADSMEHMCDADQCDLSSPDLLLVLSRPWTILASLFLWVLMLWFLLLIVGASWFWPISLTSRSLSSSNSSTLCSFSESLVES